MVLPAGEADHRRATRAPSRGVRPWAVPGSPAPYAALSQDGAVRQQGEVLEDHADLLAPDRAQLLGRQPVTDVVAVRWTSPVVGSQQPVEHPDQGGLAGSRQSHDDEDLALVDVERRVDDGRRDAELDDVPACSFPAPGVGPPRRRVSRTPCRASRRVRRARAPSRSRRAPRHGSVAGAAEHSGLSSTGGASAAPHAADVAGRLRPPTPRVVARLHEPWRSGQPLDGHVGYRPYRAAREECQLAVRKVGIARKFATQRQVDCLPALVA